MNLWDMEVEEALYRRWRDGYLARGGEGTPPWPPINQDGRPWMEEAYEELLDYINYLRADMAHFGRDPYEWPEKQRRMYEHASGLLTATKLSLTSPRGDGPQSE